MVTTPHLISDPQLDSPTGARTRIPEFSDHPMAFVSMPRIANPLIGNPSTQGLAGNNLSNQNAIASPPQNSSAYASLLEAMEKIAKYSELPANWDSYGGVGLTQEARGRAQNFVICLLGEDLIDALLKVDILPVPTGGIQFEWKGSGGEIEVEIDQHGNLYWLIEHKDGSYEASPRERPAHWSTVRNQIKLILG